jgi:hypothetical protein
MWEIPMLGVLSIAACNHSKASSYSFEMADTTRDQRIRKKIPRFRILIMGRANAGKTTILQRVCKTTEAPEVIDRNGNKVGPHLYPDHDEQYLYLCRSAFRSSKAHEKYVSRDLINLNPSDSLLSLLAR